MTVGGRLADVTEEPGRSAIPRYLSRRTILRLSVGSVVVLAALAWLIAWIRGMSLASLFVARHSVPVQLVLGALFGSAVAAVVILIVARAEALASLREIVRTAMTAVAPTRLDMLFVSVNAGVGEELFFRGALQPLVGLAPAAALFAVVHTGLPRTRGVAMFCAYVFAMGVGLGALYRWSGLVAAMTAHALFDVLLLLWADRALRGRRLATAGSAN